MESLRRAFEMLEIEVTDETIMKFQVYMDMILEWNEKVNLTAITDRDEFIKKHYIDSIICCNFEEVKKANVIIDVGTGGGFPGIPLALIFPQKQFVLMDSLLKRLNIIDDIAGKIGITNVKTLHGRAEDLARTKDHREKYDLCVARAVANLATLSEYCLPFIKKGGSFLAYKALKADEEIKDAAGAVFLLGGKIVGEKKVVLPDFDLEHNIIVVEKVAKTPAGYPRKAGTPSKEPLK